jgi:hypothetical protein
MQSTPFSASGSAPLPRLLLALALALPALPLTGCGGKGGGGGGNPGETSAVKVTAVFPAQGPFIGGTQLRISGEKFLLGSEGINEVFVGGIACTNVTVIDAMTLTCYSPAGTPGAQVDVEVRNTLGTGKLTGGFRYFLPAPPASDINDDGIADLLIGASDDDTQGLNAGAVYVFLGSRTASELNSRDTSAADIKLYGALPGDMFGSSLCMGDVNGDGVDDLVVGAEGVDGVSTLEVGAVHVFFGPIASGAVLNATQADHRVLGDDTVAGDRFGAVTEVGDVNADGSNELMVSATRHDIPGMVDAGCVYVLGLAEGPQGMSTGDAIASVEGAQQNQRLGDSITCGDLNADAGPDMVVGAMGGDPLLPPWMQVRGRVYVVPGGESFNSISAANVPVIFSGEEVDDQFGTRSAVGDVNGDGIADLVVSAPINDYYGADFGRAYVFLGGENFEGGSAAIAQAKFTGLYSHNSIGSSLVVADADGDFIDDIVLGAPHATNNNLGDGRVYLFRGKAQLPAELVATDADAIYTAEANLQDGLGRSVSLLDMNGDGLADLAAGSTYHNGGSGRVYVYHWQPVLGSRTAADANSVYSGASLYQGLGNSIAEGL